MLEASTIQSRHSDLFKYRRGNLHATASVCRVPEETCADSLVYLSDSKHLTTQAYQSAAILIVHERLLPQVPDEDQWSGCLFTVSSIPTAMATLSKYFCQKRARFTQWGEQHPSALVHPSATLGKNVVLGPYCVIGANARIGDDCLIGSHTVIENDAQIGARTMLHPHVFIGSACVVGTDCEIHPHTSVGSDGFGYDMDATGRPIKISQLGNVVIGNDVEIGSNCAIDRATLTSTFIRDGAKLDNICHIAHNCDLGENGLYTAGFMMAGSTKIGRQFRTGGNSVVSAHLTLADNVALAGRSTVTKDITKPGAYAGYPLQPLQESLKTMVSLVKLPKMRRELKMIMKHMNLSDPNGPENST